MARILALIISALALIGWSAISHADINPFKKAKSYKFKNNIAWYLKEDSAVKSGTSKDGADTLYYHLNISKDRLRLRLGKNDPSGELEDTRSMGKLAIVDVKLDGKRLDKFQWCLDNQERPDKKLDQGAVVANDACVNAGGGDFIINLDEASRSILMSAQKIDFVVEPFGRPVNLSYTMAGFAGIMSQLDKPKPEPKPVEKKPEPKIVAAKPKPKPKPIPKKVVKMCSAEPPADFAGAIKSISYPCVNTARKAKAEAAIAASVEKEKQKMAAELERIRQEEEAKKKALVNDKREIEWAKKQADMWIKRCSKHWSKGTSPCFCEKYLDQAPEGVTNTCGG